MKKDQMKKGQMKKDQIKKDEMEKDQLKKDWPRMVNFSSKDNNKCLKSNHYEKCHFQL